MKNRLLVFFLLLLTVSAHAQQKNTKKEVINYIQLYYKNFKTGFYETPKTYRQFSGNYTVIITGCQATISYEEIIFPNDCKTAIDYEKHNWLNLKNRRARTIALQLTAIDSISKGTTAISEKGELVNSNLKFYSKQPIATTAIPEETNEFSGKPIYKVALEIEATDLIGNEFDNLEIVSAFNQLIAFCKK
jgi:hypothetical protein